MWGGSPAGAANESAKPDQRQRQGEYGENPLRPGAEQDKVAFRENCAQGYLKRNSNIFLPGSTRQPEAISVKVEPAPVTLAGLS